MKVGKAQRVATSKCTSCERELDGVTGVGCDTAPEPGDFTVCIRCGHIMAFGDDLHLRDLTDDEMMMVAGDDRVIAIQKARAKIEGEK